MSRKLVSIGSFVETLRSFENGPITRDVVAGYCSDIEVTRASLEPYVHFHDANYTRNLIHRDEQFEIMAVCWQPGQRTPIHTHNGQLGWMIAQRGTLAVINYKWLGCNASDNQNVVGLDCLAGATELDIERREVLDCYPGGPVSTVDKAQTIHQVVVQGREPVISLHIYSRPIDSCVAFDLKTRQCYRRTLAFFSRHGQVLLDTPLETPPQASPAGARGFVPLAGLRAR